MVREDQMTLKVGNKVFHEVYGTGTVEDVWPGSGRNYNYDIRFEKGGPRGWADDSTNDPKDLKLVN
jgi:hypothetical protein